MIRNFVLEILQFQYQEQQQSLASLSFLFKTVVATKTSYLVFVLRTSPFFGKTCLSVLIYVVLPRIFISKLFTFLFSVLNFVILTTSLSTTSLNLFKATGTVFNLPTSKSFTFVFKLFKIIIQIIQVTLFQQLINQMYQHLQDVLILFLVA